MKKVGLRDVDVYVKGIGSGREAAVRALVGQGVGISSINYYYLYSQKSAFNSKISLSRDETRVY